MKISEVVTGDPGWIHVKALITGKELSFYIYKSAYRDFKDQGQLEKILKASARKSPHAASFKQNGVGDKLISAEQNEAWRAKFTWSTWKPIE
jgi:hypothetical protein